MPLKPSEIYAKSATIDELLSSDFITLNGQKLGAEKATLRLAAWCRSVASGNWNLFYERLKRDKLDLEFVLGRFSNPKLADQASIPQWAIDAVWVSETLCTRYNISDPGADPQALPFDDIFKGLVDAAYKSLPWADLGTSIFSADARQNLQKALLANLSLLCTPVLYELFTAYKQSKGGNDLLPSDSPSRTHYIGFIAYMQKEGFAKLFDEKPVLLRLITILTTQWIQASTELLQAIAQDWELIQKKFLSQGREEAIQVIRIESSLSDHHHSGRSVHLIEFSDSTKVLYKPKSPKLDQAFAVLIDIFNQYNPPISLRLPSLLAMDGYSWVEFIPNRPCTNIEEVDCYFYRAGAWLAIFHLYAAMDMHYENIIADGEHPIPIDLEMLLQASDSQVGAGTLGKRAQELAVLKTQNSVLMVGLLPTYSASKDGKVISVGGLEQSNRPGTKKEWRHVNTDDMSLFSSDSHHTDLPSNLPILDGQINQLGDHLDSFLEGFEAYARYVVRLRDQLGIDALLKPFEGLQSRKVFRPTRFYYALMQRLRDHRNMRDSITWSAELDFICRFADWENPRDPLWPVMTLEREDMAELNVPFFHTSVDKRNLLSPRGREIEIQSKPGLQRAYERIASLDEAELKWQCQIIKASTTNIAKYKAVYESSNCSTADHEKASDAYLLGEVNIIARTVADLATRCEDSATWIGIQWIGDSGFAELAPLGPDLYNGSTGIALFLAGYGSLTKDQYFKDLAIISLAGLRKDINGLNAQRFARSLGLGGASGLGSVVYGLATLSEILHNNELLKDAKVAASLFTKELIESDQNLDVIGGVAGAILSVLKLYRICPEPWILEKAVWMGEYLIKQNRSGSGLYKSFSSIQNDHGPMSGMSHGAAGYAYALAALAKASGRRDFEEIAQECLRFENERFNEEYQNWPPIHQPGKNLHDTMKRCMWCHGAVGVGLARLASEKFSDLDTSDLRFDIDRSIRGARKNMSKTIDSLCCGAMGRVELFYEVGKTHLDSELIAQARQQLFEVIEAAHQSTYRFGGAGGIGEFHLGLFRGISGVGYTILRQLNPNLPNVLIWE